MSFFSVFLKVDVQEFLQDIYLASYVCIGSRVLNDTGGTILCSKWCFQFPFSTRALKIPCPIAPPTLGVVRLKSLACLMIWALIFFLLVSLNSSVCLLAVWTTSSNAVHALIQFLIVALPSPYWFLGVLYALLIEFFSSLGWKPGPHTHTWQPLSHWVVPTIAYKVCKYAPSWWLILSLVSFHEEKKALHFN